MKQKLFAIILAMFLFLGIVWTNTASAWIASIRAEGEYTEGLYWYIVKAGVATEAQAFPSPPPAYSYSVKMDLYPADLSIALSEDIRQEGDLIYTWIIGINPSGNIEPSGVRTATISWDPAEFGPGSYKLQQGYDGTGPIVVADMRTTTSYNVTGPASFQFFTLIFNIDQCPDDPYKTEPGICGCGVADTDTDHDGVPACNDCDDSDNTAYPGAPEMCDSVDNDCDYQIDEGLERPCSTACGAGIETCENGQWVNCTAPAVEVEVCDGKDNDCDGSTDEGLGQTTCGVGECRVTVQNCIGGIPQTCIPGTPGSEVCDGKDNDCDGSTDEGLGQTTCGVGECRVTVQNCIGGVLQSCIPGTPGSEVCDGKDNDCDGSTDEGLGQTTCGVGECRVTVQNCIGGVPQTCIPGTPGSEVCDGKDNDCDGSTDEGLGQTTCGVGECRVTVQNCIGGVPQTCIPGTPGSEVCDGKDNDCDGSTDEGLGQTTCGVGECRVTVQNCIGGVPQTCIPGTPGSEVCDGKDNDCDGSTDEGLGQTTCGVGECRVTVQNCIGGVLQTCIPGTPGSEVCDGKDNDCDNQVDENLVQNCSSICGTGTETCENGQWINCTAPIPPCEGDISIEMNLSKGWSMISLPVIPNKALVQDLFPGIVVAYDFDESLGYFRVEEDMEMKPGTGYWILLNEDKNFIITGQSLLSYNYSRNKAGWEMIGGCSGDAKAVSENCVIIIIYKFEQSSGYQRLLESENLLPGQAYWILFNEVVGQCNLTVEIINP